jgi:hypothetical protein
MSELELTAEPTAFLNHVEDVLPDIDGLFFLELALRISALHSLDHVQCRLWFDGVKHIPEVFSLRLELLFLGITTVIWEVLGKMRMKPESRLVNLQDLDSIDLRNFDSTQILCSHKLKVRQGSLHLSLLSGYPS